MQYARAAGGCPLGSAMPCMQLEVSQQPPRGYPCAIGAAMHAKTCQKADHTQRSRQSQKEGAAAHLLWQLQLRSHYHYRLQRTCTGQQEGNEHGKTSQPAVISSCPFGISAAIGAMPSQAAVPSITRCTKPGFWPCPMLKAQ